MNRTIKFRGLRTNGKGWAYGYYFHHLDGQIDQHIIIDPKGFDYQVKPETVGQFVLTNVDAIDVFEGDISIDGWEVYYSDKANAFMVRRGDMYKDLGGWFKPDSNIHEQ